MRRFAALFESLDSSNSQEAKLKSLLEYFREGEAEDLAWAIYFLSGRKIKRVLSTTHLRNFCLCECGLADWLFQECYDNVGDLAETVALLLPEGDSQVPAKSLSAVVKDLQRLKNLNPTELNQCLRSYYGQMNTTEKLVFGKLLTGGFRVGVSAKLTAKAIARLSGLSENIVQERLMGDFKPSAEFYSGLISEEGTAGGAAIPYPFFLAHPLHSIEEGAAALDISSCSLEWKWDGIRSQLIKRGGQVFVWSRGEELITERFPEVAIAAARLPDGTVLDGEILAFAEGDVLPFSLLQRRLGRSAGNVSKKMLAEIPCVFMAFDLLEAKGQDLRERPLIERRAKLLQILTPGACSETPSCAGALSEYLRVSTSMSASTWQEAAAMRSMSRSLKVEGLMLKDLQSVYGIGRKRGSWWKWKVDPYSIDAVLVYAQRGHGRRASLYTDYTFALWHEGRLVPIAKAYSGLNDEEIRQVDAFVKSNTLEKFGPVRTVKPALVFELAFEGIQLSSRHKSGVAVRFPRIARTRFEKTVEEADQLSTLKALAALPPPAKPRAVPADFIEER